MAQPKLRPAWAVNDAEPELLSSEEVEEHNSRLGNARKIPVDKIRPDPDQPRKFFDEAELEVLAQSLARRQLQPCVVVRDASSREERYILQVGERRWRAARKAQIPTLDCIIDKKRRTPDEIRAWQVEENNNRSAMTMLEMALYYDYQMKEHGWSAARLAKEHGLSASTISRTLAILNLSERQQQLAQKFSHRQIADVLSLADEASRDERINAYRSGETVAAPGHKTNRPKPKDRTHKKRTVDGAKIVVTAPVPLSNTEVAARLYKFAEKLIRDGRGKAAS